MCASGAADGGEIPSRDPSKMKHRAREKVSDVLRLSWPGHFGRDRLPFFKIGRGFGIGGQWSHNGEGQSQGQKGHARRLPVRPRR